MKVNWYKSLIGIVSPRQYLKIESHWVDIIGLMCSPQAWVVECTSIFLDSKYFPVSEMARRDWLQFGNGAT